MNQTPDEIRNRMLARSAAAKGQLNLRLSLSIAVLGPGFGVPLSDGGKKRQQIRDALVHDGHNPFFPEEAGVTLDPLDPVALDQEVELLSDPNVHLIFLLHTDGSAGVMGEIYRFYGVPEIETKTAVMIPAKYYRPQENVFGNTVQRYRTKFPYDDYLFETCQLVSECRRWAETMATGQWPTRQRYQA